MSLGLCFFFKLSIQFNIFTE